MQELKQLENANDPVSLASLNALLHVHTSHTKNKDECIRLKTRKKEMKPETNEKVIIIKLTKEFHLGIIKLTKEFHFDIALFLV